MRFRQTCSAVEPIPTGIGRLTCECGSTVILMYIKVLNHSDLSFFSQILQLLISRSSGVWRACDLLRGPAGQRHRVELPVRPWSPAAGRVHCSEYHFSGRLHRGDLPLDRAAPGPDGSRGGRCFGGSDSGGVYHHTPAGKHQLA